MFVGHAALKHLFAKNDTKPRLIRWILLHQEFDIEIKDRKGYENFVADHLSRIFLEKPNDLIKFSDHFPDEQLFAVSRASLPWFAHIVNYFVTGEIPPHWSKQEKDRFFSQVRHYYWKTLIFSNIVLTK